MRTTTIVLALSLLSFFAAACGVAFSTPSRSNTLLQSLHVTGRMVPGAPLTAALAYQQYLPVPIDVTCDLWQHSAKVKPIGKETVPELPGGSPKETPFPGNFSFDFTVDRAGTYRVECYTANDEDNTIAREFTVRDGGATPAPTR